MTKRLGWIAMGIMAACVARGANDDFSGSGLSSIWETPGKGAHIADGRVLFPDRVSKNRAYLRTVKSDWAAASFAAEVSVSVQGGPEGCAFFGLGSGQTGGSTYGTPDAQPAVYVLLAPDGFCEGMADVRLNGTSTARRRPGPGDGTRRVRLVWDAGRQTAYFVVGADGKGIDVQRDILLKAGAEELRLDAKNARLFFGGGGGAAFDDFTVGQTSAEELATLRERTKERELDPFEQIAQEKNANVPGLAGNPPPKLPDISLPWNSTPATAFEGADKIDTQQELDAELQRMREQYAPFMADLAPALKSVRPRMELETFGWRLETAADRADIAHALEGEGAWTPVQIPHYGGPVNKATSYYRATLTLDTDMLEQDTIFLHFQGADYIADVYVNGEHMGSHEGLFDPFEFDIKSVAKAGENVLLVKLRNDAIQMGDNHNVSRTRQYGKKFAACGGPGWDEPVKGWTMCPVGFGLWQRVWIEGRSSAFVQDIFVRPLPHKNEAEVWVEVRTPPGGETPTLSYSLYGQNFKAALAEDTTVATEAVPLEGGVTVHKFTVPVPAEQLRWWSPAEPWLYQVQIQLTGNGTLLDTAQRQFGMRTFVQSAASKPKGRFYLNGKEIRLRGANMMGNLMQCVIRKDFDQLRDDILLAKIANMNFWRTTQQPCQEEVYDYFDRLGMMAQTDLPVFVGIWREQAEEGLRQAIAMERLVRGHPCNAVITYINEVIFKFDHGRRTMLPRGELLALFRRFDEGVWALNPDQVIKWADGDYANISQGYSDHHCYTLWYRGHTLPFRTLHAGGWASTRAGWMHGCGEFGAEALDSVATMKKYYPETWTKTGPNGEWSPRHIYRNQTLGIGPRWFGFTPKTMEEWVSTSHNHQKLAVRLQTEALRRDLKMNSFAIHLLIDAWPSGWMKSIMDYDRQAKPAYYEYRDALTPMAVNLRPSSFYAFAGDKVRLDAWVCNDTQRAPEGATLRYQVKLGERMVRTGSVPARIAVCGPAYQGKIVFEAPRVEEAGVMVIHVGLFDAGGTLIHDTLHRMDVVPKPAPGEKAPPNLGGQAQRVLAG